MLLHGVCVLLVSYSVINCATYIVKKLGDKYAVRLIVIGGGAKQNEKVSTK